MRNQIWCLQKTNEFSNFDQDKATKIASNSLDKLKVFTKDDFRGLGLEEKMQDKIFNNLIIKGYIQPDGRLNEEDFPVKSEDFKINNSSVEESKEIFEIIHNLFVQENKKGVNYSSNGGSVLTEKNGTPSNDFAVFISDFDALDLSEVRKTELYDNLIFNGYIDEEGTVLQPQFFSDDDNYVNFEANANIDVYSKAVYDIIQTNIDQFNSKQLKLDKAIFSSLPLKEIEVNDLVENLKFNEYIDEQSVFTNKAEMLSIDVNHFNLALMFYPYRHKILEAIQSTIRNFKSNFYTLKKEALKSTADQIVSEMVYDQLSENYLSNGKLEKDQILFFVDDKNTSQLNLGKYFDDNAKVVVFQAIQKIIHTGQKYPIQ